MHPQESTWEHTHSVSFLIFAKVRLCAEINKQNVTFPRARIYDVNGALRNVFCHRVANRRFCFTNVRISSILATNCQSSNAVESQISRHDDVLLVLMDSVRNVYRCATLPDDVLDGFSCCTRPESQPVSPALCTMFQQIRHVARGITTCRVVPRDVLSRFAPLPMGRNSLSHRFVTPK